MIVVDTSAVVSVILGEEAAPHLLEILRRSDVAISTASVLEAAMVVESRQGSDAAEDLNTLLEAYVDEYVDVDMDIVRAARSAFRKFGKGNHPARLNFGDCISYATAHEIGAPLLYLGNDFSLTDIEPVVVP